MKIAFCVLLVACNSDKPKATTQTAPSAASAKEPSKGPSLFTTNRAAACAAFADRMTPAMKNQQPMDAEIIAQCMNDDRITKNNYSCLMAATSAEGVGACFSGVGTGSASTLFETDKKAACTTYAKHMIELMSADLKLTAVRICTSERISEEQYNCVMETTTDDAFKRCLGVAR